MSNTIPVMYAGREVGEVFYQAGKGWGYMLSNGEGGGWYADLVTAGIKAEQAAARYQW